MSNDRAPGERNIAMAALLVGFQSVMSLIVTIALFASAHRAARWLLAGAAHRRLELAWIMLVVTIVAVVIAVALASFTSWGRVAALLFEAFAVIAALARATVNPFAAIVALAIAGSVIWLVASAHFSDDDGNPAAGNTADAGPTSAPVQ